MNPRGFVILPCAGSGTRMGGNKPKFLLDLGGTTVLGLTLKRLHDCEAVDQVVIVLAESLLEEFAHQILPELPHRKVSLLVSGGSERQHSIWNGLQALQGKPGAFQSMRPAAAPVPLPAQAGDIVAVHDAVRPFAMPQDYSAVLRAAQKTGAALLAIPAQDTIKEVSGENIRRTIPRESLVQAQTPQAFRLGLLVQAYERAYAENRLGTDDASLVEALGLKDHPVTVVMGHKNNLKVTTPEDLFVAQALWARENSNKRD